MLNGEYAVPLIVLEGIDISGKQTHTLLLAKKLTRMGRSVECITFPDYKTPLGREIKRFLKGRVRFRPEVLQLLYVANRWERERDMDAWLSEGKIVIADRYIPSGLAYGLANNLNLDWMLKLEEGLLVADMVIIIDIPVDTALSRKEHKDIYEKNRLFQEKVRKSYLDLTERFGWIVIDGDRPIEDVAEQIWVHVSKKI